MNEIVNKFLSAGNKFMPEMHLKQPGFTYSASGPFTKNKERIQKFKETGDTKYIYKNELDKACFQHNMAYGGFKDLARRKLASMVYKFFDKKSADSGVDTFANKSAQHKQLAKELHKPIIRSFKTRTIYSGLKNNIWDVDLVDMQLISQFNRGFRFLLCIIDIFSKCAWVIPLA